MFIKYLEGLKPLKITENKKLGLDFGCNINRLCKTNGMHIKYLQIGERTITTPIGYRKKVVLSKKGRTTATDVNQLINLMLFKTIQFRAIHIWETSLPRTLTCVLIPKGF